MYSKNLQNLLAIMLTKEGALNMNFEDDIIKGTTITMNGEIIHEATNKAMGQPAATS
jgi:NAD(P) transhydrogenase subunit alpha